MDGPEKHSPSDALERLYFAHDDMFMVPIEHLSPEGVSSEYRTLLAKRRRLPGEWVDLFNEAFSLYRRRAADLAGRAPRHWFPPRLQHVCIVTTPERVRPFFQPINKSSWLLYESDFDPRVSNLEFATYQFFQAERMGLLQEVTQAVIRNLSYFVVREPGEVEAFREACHRTPRPDAPAFSALARVLGEVRGIYHESLKPPLITLPEPYVRDPHTGLLLPRSAQPRLRELVEVWTRAAQDAMARFYRTYSPGNRKRVEELCDRLRRERPEVVVTGSNGGVLWAPDAPERTEAILDALEDTGEAALQSIWADLVTIDRHSRAFRDALREPEGLPDPGSATDQSGLCYLHLERKRIAYNLDERGMERRRVPGPPYERSMLGARTAHEWAHLAAEAGWVGVSPERRDEHERLRESLAEIFERVYREAPAAVRAHTVEDLASLGPGGPRELVAIPMERLPDYQANLLAQRFLSLEERETYVRNNVYSLSLELPSQALFRRLARYAFEYQYLRFSQISDPTAYFFDSTWFDPDYLATAILSKRRAEELFETTGRLLGCYAVDETRFWPLEPSTEVASRSPN